MSVRVVEDPEESRCKIKCCKLPKLSPQNKAKGIILGNFIGVGLNIFDTVTDGYSAAQHHHNDDMTWFGMTLASLIIPMILASFGVILLMFTGKNNWHCLLKMLLVPTVMVCSPIIPVSILIWKCRDSIIRYPDNGVDLDNDPATVAAIFLKFVEAVTESLPQSALQTYVAVQMIIIGQAPEWWQWLTITASLLALAYSIVSNDFFSEFPIGVKVGLFVMTLLFFLSRILVACVYSTITKGLFFVPVGVELGTYIIVPLTLWCINKYCCQISSKVKDAILYTMIALAYSSNMIFAIGGYFLPVLPVIKPLTLATLIIASISWPGCYLAYKLTEHFYSNADDDDDDNDNDDAENDGGGGDDVVMLEEEKDEDED